jgi:hypothetical protein
LPFGRESLYLINKLNIEGNPAARLHDDRFPNETSAYCTARDTLLTAEMELRAKVEEDAALRRTLPLGGALKTDYVLTEGPADLSAEDAETQTRFPELFPPGKDTLIVYSFIYPEGGNPCPACTSLIDGLDGQAPHINPRVNFAVFAKTPVAVFRAWGRERGWAMSASCPPAAPATTATMAPNAVRTARSRSSTSSSAPRMAFSIPGGRSSSMPLPPKASTPVTPI